MRNICCIWNVPRGTIEGPWNYQNFTVKKFWLHVISGNVQRKFYMLHVKFCKLKYVCCIQFLPVVWKTLCKISQQHSNFHADKILYTTIKNLQKVWGNLLKHIKLPCKPVCSTVNVTKEVSFKNMMFWMKRRFWSIFYAGTTGKFYLLTQWWDWIVSKFCVNTLVEDACKLWNFFWCCIHFSQNFNFF